MSEPIAVEESVDEGSLPESRNFICGVVEGPMENQDNPALLLPNKGANMKHNNASSIASALDSLHLSDNPGQHAKREKNADKTQASDVNLVLNKNCTLDRSSDTNKSHEGNHKKDLKKLKRQGKSNALMMERKNKYKKPPAPVDLPNPCATPWKCKKLRTNIEENISTSEYTFNEALFLLNALDKENFYTISKRFFSLNVTENNVERIIQILFKKASEERFYVEEYADVILKIYEMVNGKNSMCNLETNFDFFANKTELKNAISTSINKGIEITLRHVSNSFISLLKGAEITDNKREYRDSLVNCLIFISALFKRNLIETNQILDVCSYLIQEEKNDMALQCLAVFLMKSGEKIEKTVESLVHLQLNWNQVIGSIQKTISNKSTRCKKTWFLLQDFIEMKLNGWLPPLFNNSEAQKYTATELIKREKKRFKYTKNKKDITVYYANELQHFNVAQNPWKRGCFKCKEWFQEADIIHRLKMLLNIINEPNFHKLLKQFIQKFSFKPDNIDSCVEIVLNKCIQDTMYNKIYLKLLKSFAVHKKDQKSERKTSDVDSSVLLNLLVKKSIHLVISTHLEAHESQNLRNIYFIISELFNSYLMSIDDILDLLLTLVCQEEEQKLIHLARILFLCGRNVEKAVAKNRDHQVQWTNIIEKIDNVCVSKHNQSSKYVLLMLTTVLNLKQTKWLESEDSVSSSSPIKIKEKVTRPKISKNHQKQVLRKEKEEKMIKRHAHEENLIHTREQFLVKDILKDLDMVDNPWRRGEFKRDLTPSERTIMDAKTLLNKLAENNFNSIVEQFTKLNFTSDTVESILNVLFVKAVLETKFTELHAKFVKSVADIMDAKNETSKDLGIGSDGNKENRNSFDDSFVFDLKPRIVEKCVMEIDLINDDCILITDEIRHQRQQLISSNDTDPSTPDWRNCTELAQKRNLRKSKKRDIFLSEHYREVLKKKISVGTCHFLGELFNVDVVDVTFILTTLLCDLLPYETEESIECAIKLISIVGKKLERISSRAGNENYDAGWKLVLENIADKAAPENRERWSNRIYFMLLDLLDLRERDWLPRIIIVPTRLFRAPKKARGI